MRKKREKLRMKLAQMSEVCGTDPGTLSRLENGHRINIGILLAIGIRRGYGVPLESWEEWLKEDR